MGSFASKTWSEVNDYYYKTSSDGQQSPQLKYKMAAKEVHVKNVWTPGADPRSPTFDFDRTPIQVIDCKAQMTPDVVTQQVVTQLVDSIDPRSPTIGIDRTPFELTPMNDNIVEVAVTRLSFGNVSDDITNNSQLYTPTEAMTPSVEDNETKSSGTKVRTPLSSVCVQQNQTPNRSAIRQRKQLDITKRAHLNSHLMKNKAIGSNDNLVLQSQVVDDKENL
ncbi:cell division cycle-associated protein 3-like isoform X1 [Oppia nitens]|uniref:cell division cycle-associated protein 3-like isoform X1 n=1 Tax=Oppia nitens TaxID=1686743 RepID=UPI0023DCAAF2|nr:cell division cycle-associated protein 3-like isoform X1 [Oppia nitens]XP_054160675.1 cell division cycle-associated protein 3-like isoform X1 [Oppia nitens]XP_054160676.1 cell division cycle-associated protein 3-like isoform X1 [Oppia nitens]